MTPPAEQIEWLQEYGASLEAANRELAEKIDRLTRERDYWHEAFIKADEMNSLLANSRVISASPER